MGPDGLPRSAERLPRKEHQRGLRMKNSLPQAETDTCVFGPHSSARSYVRSYRRWTLDEVSSLKDAVERCAWSRFHAVVCTVMKVSKQAW